MLSRQLIALLFTKKSLQILKNHIEEKNATSKRIPSSVWIAVSIDIAAEVESATVQFPYLKTYVNKKIMDTKTLKRIFGVEQEDVNEDHGTRKKTVQTMMVYAGVTDTNNWDLYRDDSNEITTEGKLLGVWYLYRYNYLESPPVLKRSMLKLSPGVGKEMLAEYRTMTNTPEKGKAKQIAKILTITFEDEIKTRQITAYIDNDILGEGLILNGIISSARTDCPYAKHCLMVYCDNQQLSIENDRVITVDHSSRKLQGNLTTKTQHNLAIDQIVRYLTRKKKEIIAEYFVPATIKGLTDRNDAHFKKIQVDYNNFKTTFVGRWYSVSSFQNPDQGITINSYAFTFDDIMLECHFTCHRGDLGDLILIGKMERAHEQFIFNMDSIDGLAKVNAVAKKMNNERLLGSSTILIGHKNSLARELFFKSNHTEAPIGNINFETFLKIRALHQYEKAYLLSRSNSEMEWPEFDIKNYSLLNKYSGYYFVYLNHPYEQDGSLLQLAMFINELGSVNIAVCYDTGSFAGQIYDYKGRAIILNNTLRVSVQTKLEQKSEYVFSINPALIQTSQYLRGIVLETDIDGLPCAHSCVAIRKTILGFEFDAIVLRNHDDNYVKLDYFFIDVFKVKIATYFSRYPSIRENTLEL